MKRVVIVRQSTEFYNVEDDTVLDEKFFKENSGISILTGVNVVSISDMSEFKKTKTKKSRKGIACKKN